MYLPFGVLKYSGKIKMNVITIAKSNLRRAVFVMSGYMIHVFPSSTLIACFFLL